MVPISDQDLFPGEGVKMNGVKYFGGHTPDQVVAYGSAVISAAGSGLSKIFEEQLEIRGARRYPVSKLRRYDSWQEAFRDATAFAAENKRAVYHLYNSGNQETLRRYYHNVILAAITSYIRDQAEGLNADEEDIRVLAEFYSAALAGLTVLWLQSGMKYDAEEYIDHLGRLLDGNIRHTLEHSCRAAGQSDT